MNKIRICALALSSVGLSALAADLTVDTVETVFASAQYGNIVVNGTLNVTGGATLEGTNIVIGARGRIFVNASVLKGPVTFDGATAGVTNELHLVGEGALLHGAIARNGTTPSRVVFDGGKVRSVTSFQPFTLNAEGPFVLEGVNGNPIWFDIDKNHLTFGYFRNQNAELWLVGDGGVKFENQGSGAWQPLHMSGNYVFAPKEHWLVKGPITLDKYGLRAFHDYQFDNGDTPRAWVLADANAHLYLGGYRHLVSSITGPGVVGTLNGDTAASTIDAVVETDEDWKFQDRNITVDKRGAGTITFTGKVPRTVSVTDGALMFPDGHRPNIFKFYRFKVDKASRHYDSCVQFSEFRLYNGNEDVTVKLDGFSCGSTSFGGGDSPAKAVDGTLATKWCETSGNIDNAWIQLSFVNGQKVTGYSFFTANDAIIEKDAGNTPTKTWRDPVSWRLLGSEDGETWYVLDQQVDYSTTPLRLTEVGPFAAAEPETMAPIALDEKLSAAVGVNGSLAFGPNRVVEFDSLLNLGTIAYGTNNELRCGRDGTDQYLYNSAFTGSGSLVKDGTNTVVMAGPQKHTGRTVVNAGKLAMRSARDGVFKYYRFKVDAIRLYDQYDRVMQFSEFRLYNGDEDVTRSYDGFSCGSSKFADPPLHTVDGSTATKWCETSGNCNNAWIQLYFAEGQKVTGYSFCTANDAIVARDAAGNPIQTWRDPISWRLQGSVDGETWYVLDEQENYPTTPLRLTEVGPFALNDWNFSGVDTSPDVLPPTSEVTVAAGAELDLSDSETPLGALKVDMAAGAGTLRGFQAAADGELRLVNVPEGMTFDTLSVPMAFPNAKDVTQMGNWNILFDGVVVKSAGTFRVKVENGALRFLPANFMIIVR